VARILPFRAVRYARPQGSDLSALVAPPYDVISATERAVLLERDAHNTVALELPEGSMDPDAPGNRYETGAHRWREWLDSGVLAFDAEPAIYVLEQRFTVSGHAIARRGFVAAVGLEPFSAGVVLPHERTLPKALDDRLRLTRSTAANLSQVFGIFSDPAHETDALIATAMATPPLATAELDGVASTIWALGDPEAQTALAGFLAERPIYIADGHHRYTTALAYRDERRAEAGPDAHEGAPYETVLMALVNMDDPGLVVLPTHRVANAPGPFDPDAFWSALSVRFELSALPEDAHASATLAAAADRPSYIVRTKDGVTRLARLRSDIDLSGDYPVDASTAWRTLDVATLQELILSPLLDIHPDRPATLERLAFVKDAHAALAMAGEHDVAFILNATRMAQVAAVALRGETMPQKSTYFFPKLTSGLLFKSLDTL
jgi:uncharacterized protein (DUF1015 family)